MKDFSAALASADVIHDEPQLKAAIARLGNEIDVALNLQPAIFMTVMQGALPFAGQLATRIRSPLVFDYVHATRYRGSNAGGELNWRARPSTTMAGQTVLLVDDILDEGHTLQAIREFCLAEGAARVLIAVLCQKRHDRCVPGMAADFVGVEVPDRYVFGYGMDFSEQGRNLPAIYAIGE